MKETENIIIFFKPYSLGLHLFNMLSEEMGSEYKPNFPDEGYCTSKLKMLNHYLKKYEDKTVS